MTSQRPGFDKHNLTLIQGYKNKMSGKEAHKKLTAKQAKINLNNLMY